MKQLFCTSLLLALMMPAVAGAQSTRPAPQVSSLAEQGWAEAVKRLSEALRGNSLETLGAMLERGPVIRSFTSDMLQPPDRLLGATAGAQLLGAHAYIKLPTSLASDLAEDFRSAQVPDAVRKNMLFADDSAARIANH